MRAKDCKDGSACTGKQFTCGGQPGGGNCQGIPADRCPPGTKCELDGPVPSPAGTASFLKETGSFAVEDEPASASASICAICDQTKPLCTRGELRAGPPAELDIKVQDTCSGLAEIAVVISENSEVQVPSFSPGTQDRLVVTAVKEDQESRSQVELRVTDMAGNVTLCDPVVAGLQVAPGRNRVRATFGEIPAAEHFVTIQNGNPGVGRVQVIVNGRRAANLQLRRGEVRTVDIAAAMMALQNIITLVADGRPGSTALVLISDVPESASESTIWTANPGQVHQNLQWGRNRSNPHPQ